MPKIIHLANQHIDVELGREVDTEKSKENGTPVTADTWTFVFTDRTYGDQVRITVREEARDDIVKMLTGGVVLPRGFPSA